MYYYYVCLFDYRCSIYDIPTISVMQRNGRWITSDNRRLWVFQQLERLGKCDEIPVRITYNISDDKFTSSNGGEYVSVRGPPGGRWYKKRTSSGAITRPVYRQPTSISSRSPSGYSSYNTYPSRNYATFETIGRESNKWLGETKRHRTTRTSTFYDYSQPEYTPKKKGWCDCIII